MLALAECRLVRQRKAVRNRALPVIQGPSHSRLPAGISPIYPCPPAIPVLQLIFDIAVSLTIVGVSGI